MDLEAAAALLGVHYQTAYRWVRTGELPAVRLGAGYDLDPDVVERVRRERLRRRPAPGGTGADWKRELAAFAERLLGGMEGSARDQVERLQGQGLTALDLCERLIGPAVARLDLERSAGRVLPAEVIAAADLCERLLGTLAAPGRGRPRGLAVVASPVGERHRLPSLMATAALRGQRWRVQHVGSGVPAGDLADFVDETQPDLVVLSVTMREPAVHDFCAEVAGASAVPVLAGGAGQPLAGLLERAAAAVRAKRRGLVVSGV